MNLDNEDWSIVGYSSNPVPGSSIDVREIARAYTNRRDSFFGYGEYFASSRG